MQPIATRGRRAGVTRVIDLGLAAILLAACGPSLGSIDLVRSSVARTEAPAVDAAAAGEALDAFGFDLLRTTDTRANGVLSPASIALALGMARAGARGVTATQMDRVMHDLASDGHPTWLNALDASFAARTGTFKDQAGSDQQVTLRIANAPFAQKGEAWNQAFLDALASRFGAGVRVLDFKTAAEPARQSINAWVADQSEQRIKDLLAQGTLDAMTRLVLVNAIYLKAPWQRRFEEALTKPADFTRPDGSTTSVPTMHLATELRYAEGDGWKAVELPYVGGQLALTLVVPDDLGTFVRRLDATTWDAIQQRLANRQPLVELALPTFSIESKLDLGQALAGLGMVDAFDPNRADFSGMTAQEALFVSRVIHQANIDVDEKGTTASAATAVVMDASSAPLEQITFKVDHPFLFALRDVPSGAIVFLGVVTDPAATD